jgi:hypothetical protein
MGYGSINSNLLSITLFTYVVLIRTPCANSNGKSGSVGNGKSWPGVDWFDTAVEICEKFRSSEIAPNS